MPNLLGLPHVHNDQEHYFYQCHQNHEFIRVIIVRIIHQGYFLIFVDDFITFFFSDLISGHQLSLEQVPGCHKAICQNSDNCIVVIMKVSYYTILQGVLL